MERDRYESGIRNPKNIVLCFRHPATPDPMGIRNEHQIRHEITRWYLGRNDFVGRFLFSCKPSRNRLSNPAGDNDIGCYLWCNGNSDHADDSDDADDTGNDGAYI